MTHYAYEYGKRWNAKTPRAHIRFVVDKYHVSQTPGEIIAEITRRVTEARERAPDGWTDAIARESMRYALLVHERNRELYRRIYNGDFS